MTENSKGFTVDPREKLEYVLKKFYANNSSKVKDTFKVRIAGDGANVSKIKINLLNLTFTIINDDGNCKTANGNFCYLIYFLKGCFISKLKNKLR